MGVLRIRPAAVILSAALLVAALVAAGRTTHEEAPVFSRAVAAAPQVSSSAMRLRAAPIVWRGGAITTSTGETVNVRVSDALPVDVTPEGWAEFLVHLTHGPELSLLSASFVTLDEMQDICGDRAVGCYARDQLVVPGEAPSPDTTIEEIVRHEYGHHVAFHRANAPWAAVDWGPKNWASIADVCARVTRNEAFPGNESSNYALNPGEAWAEVYRLLDERKAGISTAAWPIVAPSFYPSEAALQAAERDVLEPWTGSKRTLYSRTFTKGSKKVWWIPLATALDGDLQISATVPNGADPEVALVAADRRRVVRRAQWVGQRVERLSGTVCGQRSQFVRVTPRGTAGRIRVSVTIP